MLAVMTLQSIEHAAAALPEHYEPLLLRFFRPPLRLVDAAAVIGSDEEAELRADLDTGRVASVDPEGRHPARFVNSSIDRLAQTIAAYVEYSANVREVDDERAAVRLVRGLRDRISAIDAPAVADAETWWSLILEQAEAGLL
jgi:hypothetical protein